VTLWISSDGSDLKVHSLRVFGAKEVAPAPTAGKSRYDSCGGCRCSSFSCLFMQEDKNERIQSFLCIVACNLADLVSNHPIRNVLIIRHSALVVPDARVSVHRVAASWAEALASTAVVSSDTLSSSPLAASGKEQAASAAGKNADANAHVALALIHRPSLGALFDLWTPFDLLPPDLLLEARAVLHASGASVAAVSTLHASNSSPLASSSSEPTAAAAAAAVSRTAAQIEAESFVQQMLAVCSAFPAQTYALSLCLSLLFLVSGHIVPSNTNVQSFHKCAYYFL
jgi:hypothetical protein